MLARQPQFNNDNLHRIAIANVHDDEKSLIRWWNRHYRQAPKPLEDYTPEELLVERLEEYYEKNPAKIQEFLSAGASVDDDDDWDGTAEPEVEEAARRRERRSKDKVDISKYQRETDIDLTPEQEQKILDSLGQGLPGSKRGRSKIVVDENEFEDFF